MELQIKKIKANKKAKYVEDSFTSVSVFVRVCERDRVRAQTSLRLIGYSMDQHHPPPQNTTCQACDSSACTHTHTKVSFCSNNNHPKPLWS